MSAKQFSHFIQITLEIFEEKLFSSFIFIGSYNHI